METLFFVQNVKSVQNNIFETKNLIVLSIFNFLILQWQHTFLISYPKAQYYFQDHGHTIWWFYEICTIFKRVPKYLVISYNNKSLD